MRPYYEHGGITIYHGDCREILPFLSAVDVLLTDPPYGIGADRGQSSRANKRHGRALAPSRDYGVSDWDSTPPPRWLLDEARELAQWQIIFGGNYFELPPSRCWLVWDKVTGDNDYADCELAWTNLDSAVRKFTFQWKGMLQQVREDRWHPTQKPEHVMRWALSHVPEARTMLDPFMGSGTTLRAAKDAGLCAIGIEIEERYCEIAARRLAQEVLPLEHAI